MGEAGDIPTAKHTASPLDWGSLTKLASALAVGAYAVGVVAVNTYLHELGIVDFSFAKPKLLLTGILVSFTFLLLASPPFFFAWSLARRRGHGGRTPPSQRGILLSGLIFFLVLLVGSALLCIGGRPGLGEITVWWLWEKLRPKGPFMYFVTGLLIALSVYAPIIVAAASVYAATRMFDQAKSENPILRISLKWFYFAVAIVVAVISTIGYIVVFTCTFYPAIPQEFGGGEPYYESFAIAGPDPCQLQQLGIHFDPTIRNLTQPLPVVHETDALVAVWLRDRDETSEWSFFIWELDKTQISSMLAHKQKPDKPSPLAPCP